MKTSESLKTDPENCGACFNKCPSGQTCNNGQCSGSASYATCASGTTMCNGVCVNLMTDKSNCGSCGHPCNLYSACVNGACSSLSVRFDGSWACSNAGGPFDMVLRQTGTSVSGEYSTSGQIHSGSVSGNTLTATWIWAGGDNGPVTFTMSQSGSSLSGSYHSNQYPAVSGYWNCNKKN